MFMLLASDEMMVKRSLLITLRQSWWAFKEEEWSSIRRVMGIL